MQALQNFYRTYAPNDYMYWLNANGVNQTFKLNLDTYCIMYAYCKGYNNNNNNNNYTFPVRRLGVFRDDLMITS